MIHLWPEADKQELLARTGKNKKKPIEIWQPQRKQATALKMLGLLDALYGGEVSPSLAERNGYGGAAGGGKTDLIVGVGLIACMTIPSVKVGVFRRTYPELEGADGPIERSLSLYPQAGAKYNASKHVWTFPDISTGIVGSLDGKDDEGEDWLRTSAPALRFCQVPNDKDKHKYQSWAFDVLMIDEATNFPWGIVDYLLTRNRKSRNSKIPVPFSLFSANPGMIGHMWYRKQFGIYGELYHGN